MDKSIRILISAKPGHFRESLAAILKTLPESELFLVNNLERGAEANVSHEMHTLFLADPDGLSRDNAIFLQSIKKRCPGIRCVALVDNHQQIRAANELRVDYVLPRSASARELLAACDNPSRKMENPLNSPRGRLVAHSEYPPFAVPRTVSPPIYLNIRKDLHPNSCKSFLNKTESRSEDRTTFDMQECRRVFLRPLLSAVYRGSIYRFLYRLQKAQQEQKPSLNNDQL